MKFTRFICGRAAAGVLTLIAGSLNAATVPQNLGFGLDKLVESRAIVKANPTRAIYGGYATEQAQSYAGMAIAEENGERVKVDIVPTGGVDFDALKQALQAVAPSLEITAEDTRYRGTGMLEAWLSVDDAAAVAEVKGVRAAFLALKPYTKSAQGPAPSATPGAQLQKIGTAFDQGVVQHRVDRINQIYNPWAPVNYTGNGISVGILSDSYDTCTSCPRASVAVTKFDLPGSSSNPWNTQPVVVLQDYPGGTDEGRGMTEIVYKMAPKARIAFATADSGELGFANNIRALAALPGYAYPDATQQGFKADVIADDVGYFDEPWYADGIISNGIDDVAAAGVSYFSSAGNDIGINGYESALRIVPNGTGLTAAAGNTALANTNINLAGVPANLYAGGFHNFNPASGQLDVAQTVNYTGTQYVVMQWDDPYDMRDLTLNQPPVFSATGTISTATPTVSFDGTTTPALPTFVAGTPYVIQETATSGNLDGVLSVYDAAGNLIVSQDTGTDETLNFYPPATGQYKVTVGRYSTTTGNFTLTVNTAQGSAGVTTDLNLLVFRQDTGAYISASSLTTNNLAINRPIELGQFKPPSGQTQLQFVIARANTPTATQLPTRVRWVIPGNGASGLGPAEYFSYNAVTTGGHATAAGCNGTAAYSVFKPNLPESFTSPGPATILFDKNSNRLATPDIRQQPRLAAADAGNTSFFSSDTTNDLDTNPNFSGTSAAAPHAGAIAALVLESRGGPRSVTPAQMTSLLEASAFPHDLDPSSATGTAVTSDGGGVVITIDSDNDANTSTGQNDPSSFKISYVGPGSLASITFNPAGTDVAGGNASGGNSGEQDNAGSSPATITFFENSYPGLAFLPATKAFTLGPLTGLTSADITAPASTSPYTGFSNLAPAPGNGTSQFRTMKIAFPTGNFTDGKIMRFTVGRGAQHSAVTGNGTVIGAGSVTSNPIADLFGGGVLIPSGLVVADGMSFSGTTTAGGTFSGTIKNRIGSGYTVVDGYGFIDASVATGVVNRTLVAAGSATPPFAAVSGSVLFTVNVTPGTNPASTGVYVTGDLSSIGGSLAQRFYDDGTHGDAVAGDNVYSFSTTVGAGIASGSKSIPIAVADAQSREGSAAIGFSVLAGTAPRGVGSASPNSVAVTQSSLLTVAVTPGTGPASTGIAVKADLTGIGGSATQIFYDDGTHGDALAGDGTYSYSATVAAGTSGGSKSLPATITDAQGRSANAAIALDVATSGGLSLAGSGVAEPSTARPGDSPLLMVAVTPATNPTSSGVQVSADLSAIGGSATQVFYDDGTHGDAVAGDGVYSYRPTVPTTTTSGSKSLPVTITDAQARNASTTIGLTVSPSATALVVSSGVANPSTVNIGGTTLLTAIVTPGANPASSGVSVRGDLSTIGGSSTQVFYDDGTHGDVTSGDGVYSFSATVAANTVAGSKNLTITASDAQSRTASTNIAVTVPVQTAPAASSATASVTSVPPGSTTQLSVIVTGGTNPTSTGLQVTADLSAIGGSATQALSGSGNTFTYTATVAAATTAGVKQLPIRIVDAQGRTASSTIGLSVPSVGSPSGSGVAAPTSVNPGGSALLMVSTVPGSNPTSTGLAVTVNTTAIGGAASQTFYDDGTHGDQTAGDGVFSFQATVSSGTSVGQKSMTATITDAQSRTGSAVVSLSVTATPTSPAASSAVASPAVVSLGGTTQFTVMVTPGTNPASTGIQVSADLTSIGGSATQAFTGSGNTFTFNATVPTTTAVGVKLLPVTITDAQGRTSTATLGLSVPAQGAPSGTGLAAPASVSQGGSSLLLVSTIPGSNPTSTGIAVKVDMTSVGGTAATTFYDDGTHGDQAAGDGVFSLQANVPAGTTVGQKNLSATITDAQGRSSSAVVQLSVVAAPSAPVGNASAAPSELVAGATTHLIVAVTPGANPVSTGLQASVDLSAIGGSATQALHDDGGGQFSYDATVAAGTSAGVKVLPVTIGDAQGRTGSASIGLVVLTPQGPSGTGLVVPGTVAAGSSTLLLVTTHPGSNPVSTGLHVMADLTAIGGGATQVLYDDGTHGDQTAGDGVFSLQATVAASTPVGSVVLPATVADDQGRSGNAVLQLQVEQAGPGDVIFEDGFDGN